MHNLRPLALSSLMLASAFLVACPDPQGRYDEFGEKTEEFRGGSTNNGQPNNTVQVDFSGRYFMALATVTAPSLPIYFDTTVTVDENFLVDFSFQPLKTDTDPLNGSAARPDARTPAGDPIVVEDVQLTEEGTFTLSLVDARVNGEANPLSGGNILATIELEGFVTSSSSWCGLAGGAATEPTTIDLTGSTFGAGVVSDETIAEFVPIPKCEGSVVPEPDMGDMGDMGDMDGDMGPDDVKRCPDGLEGDYLLTFKADVQTTRNQVAVTIEASDDPEICYSGTVNSLMDDSQIGTVEYGLELNDALTIFIPDFTIPPGASALLPNGGVAALTLTSSHWTLEGACGELLFALESPAISSPGDFAMIRAESENFTIQESNTSATCTAIVPNEDCGLAPFAGTWDLKFETQSSQGNPTLVTLEMATHPLTCLTGAWIAKSDGETVLATLQQASPLPDGQLELQMRNFRIPPGANPLLANGGTADVEIITTQADSDAGTMCGTVSVNLFLPFTLASAGTFAASNSGEPAESSCPE